MRILPILILAAGAFAEAWLPQVARKFKQTPEVKIPLEWTVTSAGGFAPPRTTKGTLKIADGNRFRFDSDALVAVCDGSAMWQWNGSTNQVLIHDAAKVDQAGLPAGLLKAALEGAETASSPDKLGGKSVQKLTLDVSRGPLSKFVHAWLWIDAGALRPVRIEVEDAQGGRTSWTLLKIQSWKPKPSDFVYSAPQGADVVDMRR